MIETSKTISEWSKQTFPTLTENAQREKLIEELVEYINAKTNEQRVKELADIYIVSSILKERFGCDLGFTAFKGIPLSDESSIRQAVDEKMAVNKRREWAWDGKVYKHKGKDGHE